MLQGSLAGGFHPALIQCAAQGWQGRVGEPTVSKGNLERHAMRGIHVSVQAQPLRPFCDIGDECLAGIRLRCLEMFRKASIYEILNVSSPRLRLGIEIVPFKKSAQGASEVDRRPHRVTQQTGEIIVGCIMQLAGPAHFS